MRHWIMTDTHFNHTEKMIEYCGRPKDYEAKLLKSLYMIPRQDCLIFLGDFCIGNDIEWHKKLKGAECKKIMVKGNHDKKSYGWYMDHGWDFVCNSVGMGLYGKKLLFSHMPMRDTGLFDLNIHGHFHNSDHRRQEPHLADILTDKHLLVMMEHEYKAISLEKLINTKPTN